MAYNWFYESRKRDVPELSPLPSEYYGRYAEGLQTPSGKFEFEAQTLKRFDPNDPDRLPICTYHESWEGAQSPLHEKYPLQMISPHSKYSFHTMGDSKDSGINDITEHRILIDGYRYWVIRMNPADAAARGLRRGELVEVFNDRGSVLCGLDTTERLPRGVVHSFESCADFRCLAEPGRSAEVNGCVNTLTSSRNHRREGARTVRQLLSGGRPQMGRRRKPVEKVHLIFDPEKCVGCYNCLLACQDEHCGNDWLPYTRAQQLHGAPWVRHHAP